MKTLSIIIISILALSLVIAGTSTLSISFDKSVTDTLKVTNDIQTIDIKATDVECNKVECWSKVSQNGLINQEWRTAKQKCSKWENIPYNGSVIIPEDMSKYCIEYIDKTLAELTIERDAWIQRRISGYASVQADRLSKEVEV